MHTGKFISRAPAIGSAFVLLFAQTLLFNLSARAAAPYSYTASAIVLNNTNAVLQGAVTPSGQNTVAWFEWGFDESYGTSTPVVAVGAGTRVQWLTNTIGPLVAQQTYHFCCVASNAAGIKRGADQVFAVGQKLWAWGDNGYGQNSLPFALTNAVALAGNDYHTLVLRSDATVLAWGTNINSTFQINVPTNLAGVTAIGAAYLVDVALKQDGTVVTWGNTSSLTNVPAAVTNIVAVSPGAYHVVALRRDGSLIAWGTNNFGQLNIPPNATNVVSISVNGYASLALKDDGTVVAWGDNYFGTTNVPPGLTNVVAIAAGWANSYALRADGSAVVWGDPTYGQFPAAATNLQSICNNNYVTIARRHDGTLLAWGDNARGQTNIPTELTNAVSVVTTGDRCLALGNDGAPTAYSQAVLGVANQDLVIALTASDTNNDAITFRITKAPGHGNLYQYDSGARGAAIADGTAVVDSGGRVIFAPAPNEFGRPYDTFDFVADDGTARSATATVTVNIGGLPFVATQRAFSITETNAVLSGMVTPNFPTSAWFEWGTNGSFQNQSPAQLIPGGGNVVWITNAITALAPYQSYVFRLVASNAAGITIGADQIFGVGRKLWAWGYNGFVPAGLTNLVAVSGGFSHVLALKTDGTVVAWGSGTATNTPPGLSNVVAISTGYNMSLALRSDGSVVGWGDVVVPADLSNVVAIACGSPNLALQRDGTLVGWGDNVYLPPPLKNIVAIATPGLALRNDGSLVGWGDNFYGQTNVPVLTNAIAVGSGFDQRLALTRDYNVVMWGTNTGYPISVPASATNLASVSSGSSLDVGLQRDGSVIVWGTGSYGATNVPAGITNAMAVSVGNFALTANRAPLMATSSTSSLPNGDVLVSLSAIDPDDDPVSFRVATLPSLGTLYQFDGVGRGGAIVAANTPVSDSNGRLVYVPGPASAATPYDTFQVIATDGVDDSDAAPVNISGVAFTHTLAASGITETNAMLNAMVTPNLLDGTAWFQWGADTNYGNQTVPVDVGFGSRVVFFTNVINTAGYQTIHFRIALSNSNGTFYGRDQQFGYGRRAWAWGYNGNGQTNLPKGLSNCVAIASGVNDSLALTTQGTIRGWGNGLYGEATPPFGLSNVIAIAASTIHSAAITSNRTVVAWGNGSFGETNVPATLSNVVSIACGSAHMIALKSDGTVTHWGYQLATLTNIPPSATNIVAIAAGYNVSIALRDDGHVVAWGDNVVTNVPANLSNVVAISARSSSCIALKRDGTVTVWGTTISNTPPTLTNIVAISAGLQGMALDNSGIVDVWGNPSSSMLKIPSALINSIAIAAGDDHAAALGNNIAPVAASQVVNGIANTDLMITLSASDINNDVCSLRITSLPTAGTLYQYATTGRGAAITAVDTTITDSLNRVVFAPQTDSFAAPYDTFQFVANDSTEDSAPATVTVNITANPLAYTEPATLITASNAVFSAMVVPRIATTAWFEWGTDTNYGQQTATVALNSSSQCVFLTNLISGLVPLQPYHFRCVASNASGISYGPDQFFAFGKSISGFYAGGGAVSPPIGLSNIVAFSAGASHALFLASDGRVILWANSNVVPSATNFVTQLTNVTAVSAGPRCSMVLYKSGTVATAPYQPVPFAATNICSIACGDGHFLALRRDGVVVAWGSNSAGQTNVPSSLNNVVAIAAGSLRSTALRADGTVVAWGGGNHLAPPAGLSNVVAIACGGQNTLAMKSDGTVAAWGYNLPGPLTNVPPAAAIAVGGASDTGYPFMVATDGTLWQRSPYYSYTTVPMVPFPGYSNITAIAAGYSFGYVFSDNLAPQARSLTYTTTPASDLRLFLSSSSFDANGDALSARILSLPAAGTLYAANGTQRGPAITTTNIVMPYPAALIYAPSTYGGPNENFSFTYLVNDGQYDSAPGTVTITVATNLQALTYAPTFITSSNATLNGAVVANVTPTGAWFEFGTNLFTVTTNGMVIVQPATNAIPLSTTVSNLTPLTTYYFRAIATNATGTNIGSLLSFTTPVPPIQISSAIVVGSKLQITFAGLSNATYSVSSTTCLGCDWTPEGSAVQIAPGVFQLSATMWDDSPMRFYQVLSP